ncbi:MAG: methylmalonyl-CoA mutase family protein [Bacteroidetes bacterium]|nr:methylmalonyl-CoA mutase family protein [Bacteroidota bacterium]
MWGDLVRTESGGKLEAQDLIWFPDALVAMEAYSESSKHLMACKKDAEIGYLNMVESGVDGLLYLTGNAGRLTWVSPFTSSLPTASDVHLLYDETAARIIGTHTHLDAHTPAEDGPNSNGGALSFTLEALSPTVDVFCWDALRAGATTQLALALYSAMRIFESGAFPQHILVAVRTDILTEASKLRALRHLLDHLWALHSDSPPSYQLMAVTSAVTLSAFEPENNMVRNSLAGLAGMLGTADFLSIQPWNVYQMGHSDPKAAELSRNLYHLWCQESHLDKVADPLAGSYSIEDLTARLIKSGWDLFLELRAHSPNGVATLLDDRLLPADRTNFEQGGRHQRGKTERVQVGVTHFTENGNPTAKNLAPVFPVPSTLDVNGRISRTGS